MKLLTYFIYLLIFICLIVLHVWNQVPMDLKTIIEPDINLEYFKLQKLLIHSKISVEQYRIILEAIKLLIINAPLETDYILNRRDFNILSFLNEIFQAYTFTYLLMTLNPFEEIISTEIVMGHPIAFFNPLHWISIHDPTFVLTELVRTLIILLILYLFNIDLDNKLKEITEEQRTFLLDVIDYLYENNYNLDELLSFMEKLLI